MNYKAALLAIFLITPLSGCMDMESWDFGNDDGCPSSVIDVDDPAYNPEFDNSDWSGKDLTGDNLSNAPMAGFDLTNAVLIDTNLTNACLNDADLTGADLTGADLTGAYMEQTRATFLVGDCPASLPTYWQCVDDDLLGPKADLSGAYIGGATLWNANLKYANFTGADLSSASLWNANLKYADFTGANLYAAYLDGADLRYATTNSLVVGCPYSLPTDWQCVSNLYDPGGGYIEEFHLLGPKADLSGADLRLTNLSGANLDGADLSGAKIFLADLSGADLKDANLFKTKTTFLVGDCPASLPTDWKCVGDDLVGPDADLGGADLGGADLRYADLSGTNLVSANLDGANLSGGFLDNADLTGVDLRYADLKSVHARNLLGCPAALPTDWQCIENTLVGPYAGLTGAILSGADLSGADLSGAYLVSADLDGANLNNAYLTGAKMAYTNLTGAKMMYTNLSGADLYGADLTGVIWDNTVCPDETNSDDNGNTCENNL